MSITKENRIPPVHPGEVLLEEFIEPMNLSQSKVARALHVPAQRINAIVRKQRSITADTALRLARFFHTTPQFWMNLQAQYDLESTMDDLGDHLKRDVRTVEEVS